MPVQELIFSTQMTQIIMIHTDFGHFFICVLFSFGMGAGAKIPQKWY
jgi:hypothetical protein